MFLLRNKPWKLNSGEFRKLLLMTGDLKALCDPWRTWIINLYSWFYYSTLRHFETQAQVVRVIYEEWLWYAICIMEPWLSHSQFCFLPTLFLVLEQVIKKSILLAYFHDSGKQNFYFRDPIFFPFANREPPPFLRPSLYNSPQRRKIILATFAGES